MSICIKQKQVVMKSIIYSALFITLFSVQFAVANTTISQRKKQINKILSITSERICNPQFLTSTEWFVFKNAISAPEVYKMTDREFASHFNVMAQSLPFSHYYLAYTGKDKQVSSLERPPFALKEIDSTTVIIKLARWSASAEAMKVVIQTIQDKEYRNLIIDLRNNRGGTLDAAVVLGQFLTQQKIDAGTYITKNWFLENQEYPTIKDVQSFPYLTDFTYNGFGRMLNQPAFRMVVPPHDRPIFSGKVLVLTNAFTASTNEPFVHIIKQQELGTIIGEPTNGAMLSGTYVKVSRKLKLFLPIADYITAEGNRLDRVGVQPDMLVDSKDALTAALKLLE